MVNHAFRLPPMKVMSQNARRPLSHSLHLPPQSQIHSPKRQLLPRLPHAGTAHNRPLLRPLPPLRLHQIPPQPPNPNQLPTTSPQKPNTRGPHFSPLLSRSKPPTT